MSSRRRRGSIFLARLMNSTAMPNAPASSPPSRSRWPSLSTSILIGLVLGILTGLFFGEACRQIKWVGDVFIGLLQMAVLPYITLSLVLHVGRLSFAQGKRLAVVGLAILAVLWLIGIVLLVALAQSFPSAQKGSFFSTHQVQPIAETNWLALFVPSNPFESLSNNMVPAVVVFSIGLGIAFIGVRNKDRFLDQLEIVVDALSRLNRMMIRISPVGIFAIAANAAGTLTVEQFGLIQGYILTYVAATILLAGIVLPLLIASFTPFSYWQVLKASRESLIAAVVIGNTFVVIPLIIEGTKSLLSELDEGTIDDNYSPEFLIPMVYAFPDIGRIVGLVFIPFAAWFYAIEVDSGDVPALVGTGFLGSFGKLVVTIPLLLDIARIPQDIFDLFLSVGVVTARFGDTMKTMHLFAFTVLACCVLCGAVRRNPLQQARNGIIAVVLTVVTVTGINLYLQQFQDDSDQGERLTSRQLIEPQVEFQTIGEPGPNPVSLEAGQSHLDRIFQRGVIRIGYDAKKLPFSFFNDQGQLVGLDIELAHQLAGDMDVTIEFVPYQRGQLAEAFEQDHFDVAVSAIEGTVQQYSRLIHSEPYLNLTLAVVVPDYRKKEFMSRGRSSDESSLRMAVLTDSLIAERAERAFSHIETIEIADPSEYYEQHDEFDGFITSAETGSAWSLIRPEFSVVNPLANPVQFPLYVVMADDPELQRLVNRWLEIRRQDGTIDRVYAYWVLGEDPRPGESRWCIARDILGWFP